MANKLPPVPYGSPPGSSFWNDWYEKLRTLINTGTVTVVWANIDFVGSNITDIVNRAHNNLQSLQGGGPGEYYHLTAAQYAALAAGPHNSLSSIQGGSASERYHLTNAEYTLVTAYTHNSLNSLQGGTAGQYYHLTSAQQTAIAAGITATITTAKLTPGGTNGSMTFTNGILTAQTAAT